MYGSHIVMKRVQRRGAERRPLRQAQRHPLRRRLEITVLSRLMFPLMPGGQPEPWWCASWAATWRRGAITVGDIQAFIQYVRSLNQPIGQFANISNVLQHRRGGRRVFTLPTEERPRFPSRSGWRRSRAVSSSGTCAGYSPEDHHQRPDGHRPARAKVAIVGPHRRRQDDPGQAADALLRRSSGAILVEGHDIREFRATTCARCSAWSCKTPGCSTAR